MFTSQTNNHPLPARRSARLARAVKVGVAVGVAVLTIPFDARAEGPTSGAALLRTDSNTSTDTLHTDDDPLLDACPIGGSSTFEDSWGWRRSGGRSHKGVDIIAERGTPVMAVRDGQAQFKNSGLGGRAIWLTTDNGDKFYYAHLDGWEGESRDVLAGEVIGYVGSSGNARGTHLHFETRPDGKAENPYPHTFKACVPPPEPVINQIAQKYSSAALASRRTATAFSAAAAAAVTTTRY